MSVSDLIAALAPAFVGDTRISTFTGLAITMTHRHRFGHNYDLAVALRVCHMIARNPMTMPGTGGAISSETEGELSRSYSIPKFLQEKYGDLCSTSYGMQLAQLIEGNIVGQLVSSDKTNGILTDRQGDLI